MSQLQEINIDFPEKLQCLFGTERYIVLYGGRGGAKSWGIARALLIQGAQETRRILCAREIQKSIQDSVHRLLADQIHEMGLGDFYEVQQTKIIGRNGTEILFAGLRHNISSLKSFEGVDDVWVEEAQAVSKSSWDVLIPTIRKPNSRIIISFNPDLEEDETYKRFVTSPPDNAKVIKIGWQDNPWFPEVLRLEKDDLQRRDEAAYKNVWEGFCKQAVDGAIFADELAKAALENRITRVTVTGGVPVLTFWDLGQSDNTAIWFCQLVGLEYRLIDYYQNNGKKMPFYFDVLAQRGYNYGDHYLPHDADHEQLAAQATIKEQFNQAIKDNPLLGKKVYIVPRIPAKVQSINAARSIFDSCIFDKDKTADGLSCLRHSRYERDEETGKVGRNPVHDIYSHGTDAFMTLAQHAKRPVMVKKPQIKVNTKWVK